MAFSLGGLIGGAMKGVGEGYGKYAEVEMDKQAKIDYATKVTQLQEEKEKRIAELSSNLRKGELEHASGVRVNEARLLPAAQAEGAVAAAPNVAKAKVAEEVGLVTGAAQSNLPELRADLTRRTLEADAPNATLKAQNEGKAAAAGQVAKTSTPGYVKSVEIEDLAKSAGERSVASISASAHLAGLEKPSITQDANGLFFTTTYDPKSKKTSTAALMGPDGKQLQGPKDLDQRTMKMVDAMLVSAKADLDPDSRAATVNQVIEMLRTGTTPQTAAPPNSAIDALRKNPNLAEQFDAKYGAGASKKYLPAQNTK